MTSELEELLEDSKDAVILLDNSATHAIPTAGMLSHFLADKTTINDSKEEKLSNLKKKLEVYPRGMLEQEIRRIDEINHLISAGRIRVLPETVKELNPYMVQLNKIIFRLSCSIKSDFQAENYKAKLESLKKYQSGLLWLAIESSKISPQNEFSPSQMRDYRACIEIISPIVNEIEKNKSGIRRKREDGTYFGSKLKTDAKIISAAYILSQQKPVVILADDRDMRAVLASAEYRKITTLEGAEKAGLSAIPSKRIEVYNPNRIAGKKYETPVIVPSVSSAVA